MSQDAEQLKLLSIFHYVLAGLSALFACLPIIHLVIGLTILSHSQVFGSQGPPPMFIGWIFVIFASLAIVLGLTFAVLVLLTGRFLARRQSYKFCFVMACIECLFMPFGTVLGIFSILVLTRESVKQLFTGATA